jgi:hypothetical protein
MGIIILLLGLYLIIIAWPEFYENYKNLMNHAIDPKIRAKLEEAVNRRLPRQCNIISPLVCYHRGNQLFIKGRLQIDRNLMQSSDVIVRNCEQLTKTFLLDTKLEVHAQFSPYFNWSEKTIEEDLNIVLQSIFKVDVKSLQSEAFRLLKHGNLDSALSLINSELPENKNEEVLGSYIIAECYIQKFGPDDKKTKEMANTIEEKYFKKENIVQEAMFLAWLLIYYTKLYNNNKLGQNIIIQFQNYAQLLQKEKSLPDYLNAELCFALGYSWERRSDYDLEMCRQLYSLSEYYYSKSAIRSETDRLMNTMGHLETLLYSLGDADIHLNTAKDIREIKNDKVGLSYTYGCLGDLYVRTGRFEEADNYYTQDVELLNELEMKYNIPSLNVKRGELEIRRGILEKNIKKIKRGIKVCQSSENSLNDPFFAKKGIIKGFLILAMTEFKVKERTESLNRANDYLSSIVPQNTYQNAFLYRLKGRYEGQLGNNKDAIENLLASCADFKKMRDPIYNTANGIQEILSSLEAFKWEISNSDSSNTSEIPVQDFQEFLHTLDGMLGESKNILNELVENLAKSNYGSQEELLKHIDILIWHLEG